MHEQILNQRHYRTWLANLVYVYAKTKTVILMMFIHHFAFVFNSSPNFSIHICILVENKILWSLHYLQIFFMIVQKSMLCGYNCSTFPPLKQFFISELACQLNANQKAQKKHTVLLGCTACYLTLFIYML